ncbi:MAG: MBL fold metallo-hydrolase [Deltaproteobacteria bacterium]|nr:MBL fold metallo-hydrolase [Deltaproteobacteria bacterium]
MTVEVEILGAAKTVTGSMHRVHTPEATILLDCGLYQGRRGEANQRNRQLPIRPESLSAVVLSHAHIDHSGLLPMLTKQGYRGPIYATPATIDLCEAMLADAAQIQAADARYLNRKIQERDTGEDLVDPLYDAEDVKATLARMVALPYHQRRTIAPGVDVELRDAGHVLGSATVTLEVDDLGAERRVVFSGDLGRRGMPILRDPETPGAADLLLLESTYGDRLHGPIERSDEALAEICEKTFARGGKVLVPSFALERAQEIVFALKRLRQARRLPAVPVYVDSPLTVRVSDVFAKHSEFFDREARAYVARGDSPFEFEGLEYVRSVERSKEVTGSDEPAVIISASGMCEAGRVLHHLKAMLDDRKHSIVIVGWQAQHTLGRRLVEGRSRVRVFGVERDRLAEVHVLDGYSAHADADDLVAFAEAVRERGGQTRVALVHGEEPAQAKLSARLESLGFPDVRIPERGDRIPV